MAVRDVVSAVANEAAHVSAATALGLADAVTGGRVSPNVTTDQRMLNDARVSRRSWEQATGLALALAIPGSGLAQVGVRTAASGLPRVAGPVRAELQGIRREAGRALANYRNGYRPEQHYLRGKPGPAWHRMHGTPMS